MQNIASEILLSSYPITRQLDRSVYEFILNDQLKIMGCIRLKSRIKATAEPVSDLFNTLDGMLFELQHVRVNPTLDNSHIIDQLTERLNEIGVKIGDRPHEKSMAMCFKPLGEISDNVRFYLNQEGKIVFLSPAATKPKLVYSKPATD